MHDNTFNILASYKPASVHEQRNFLGKKLEAMRELDKCPHLKHYLHLQVNMLLEDLTGPVSGHAEFLKEAITKRNAQLDVYKFLLEDCSNLPKLEEGYVALTQQLSN